MLYVLTRETGPCRVYCFDCGRTPLFTTIEAAENKARALQRLWETFKHAYYEGPWTPCEVKLTRADSCEEVHGPFLF